ncbi:hypothetical protein [Sphingobium cloacae]|uniref:hypothetical protein n=1 Tax=Sphingobium cloacae TaxID=120107 RepID=UPI00082CB2DD|nr:hypothetical protein [Sphingobium cloacae]
MEEEPPQPESSGRQKRSVDPARSHGSGLVFLLITLALILAIGFFYLSKGREDRRADRLTEAANSIDNAATIVGDAAKNAADAFRKDDGSGPH